MNYIIDGYNLMYAIGMAPPRNGTQTALEAARKRMLDWLLEKKAVAENPAVVRVVFDAQNSNRDFGSTTYRGLTVTFSFRQTADDLIEALVSTLKHFASACVVSNDSRLRDFARRKRCHHLSCGQFLDWLMCPPSQDAAGLPAPDDKPKVDWPDEMDTLLRAFDPEV